jgi:hypothetical protein
MKQLCIILFLLMTIRPVMAQTPTPTPSPTPEPEPVGCLRPPDDYSRVMIGESILNARTVAMLAHAQSLYNGPIDLTGIAVTQGSYNAGVVALSFGTHDGGGAVDISVRNIPVDFSIRWDDIPPLVDALRRAGFAAWYRDEADDMTPHIHAIAIGDAELSRAASLQLDGRYGYFRGFDGLPQEDGIPQLDEHGGPIICEWMRALGYEDLRDESPLPTLPYQFVLGGDLLVNVLLGEELNLRSQPALTGEVLRRLPHETPVTLLDGPRFANNYTWWQIQLDDGTVGWSVDATQDGVTLVPK